MNPLELIPPEYHLASLVATALLGMLAILALSNAGTKATPSVVMSNSKATPKKAAPKSTPTKSTRSTTPKKTTPAATKAQTAKSKGTPSRSPAGAGLVNTPNGRRSSRLARKE